MFFRFDDYSDDCVNESKHHREPRRGRMGRMNESAGFCSDLVRIIESNIKAYEKEDAPLKFAKTPDDMDMPVKWNAGNGAKGWVDLLHLGDYLED